MNKVDEDIWQEIRNGAAISYRATAIHSWPTTDEEHKVVCIKTLVIGEPNSHGCSHDVGDVCSLRYIDGVFHIKQLYNVPPRASHEFMIGRSEIVCQHYKWLVPVFTDNGPKHNVSQQHTEEKDEVLWAYFQEMQNKETFKVGDVVRWKDGLRDGGMHYLNMGIVLEVFDTPIRKVDPNDPDTALASIRDIVICWLNSSRQFAHFAADSRRLTKYK